jgi:nitroreductase
VNSIFASIYARRAWGEYKPDDITGRIIKELIKAGAYAPIALNEQSWRFLVIKNKRLMKKCSDRAKKLWLDSIKGPVDEEKRELFSFVSDPGFDIFYDALY